MPLTRIALVNQALDQAGLDTSYQAKARGWLNAVTETLAIQNNYNFYRKTATDAALVSGQSNYSLPTDFQKPDSLLRVDSLGNVGSQIFIVDPDRFDMYVRGFNGDPTLATIDIPNLLLKFNGVPTATTAMYYRLSYFRKPTTLSLDSSDDNVIPDFSDQTVLRENLIKWAYENLDDERYPQKSAEAKEANQKLMRNILQTTDTGKMQLSTENFRARRRR